MATTILEEDNIAVLAFYGGHQRGRCLALHLGPSWQEYDAAAVTRLAEDLGTSGKVTIPWKNSRYALDTETAHRLRVAVREWLEPGTTELAPY